MKLLVDMNLSPKWVGYLAAAGYEAIHWSVLGAGNAPDSEIMAHARGGNFVVLTSDLDFGAILAITHGEKPSVIQLRADNLAHDVIGKQVVDALDRLGEELERGALVTIEPERTRMRILPLGAIVRE
jgi:predicted nuclease of predicted toxin-antitoxin system